MWITVALFTVCTFKLNINKLMQAKQNRIEQKTKPWKRLSISSTSHRHTRPPDNKELLLSSSHLTENGSSNNGSDWWLPQKKKMKEKSKGKRNLRWTNTSVRTKDRTCWKSLTCCAPISTVPPQVSSGCAFSVVRFFCIHGHGLILWATITDQPYSLIQQFLVLSCNGK